MIIQINQIHASTLLKDFAHWKKVCRYTKSFSLSNQTNTILGILDCQIPSAKGRNTIRTLSLFLQGTSNSSLSSTSILQFQRAITGLCQTDGLLRNYIQVQAHFWNILSPLRVGDRSHSCGVKNTLLRRISAFTSTGAQQLWFWCWGGDAAAEQRSMAASHELYEQDKFAGE